MRALLVAVLLALATPPAYAQLAVRENEQQNYGRGSYWGSGKAEEGKEYRWRLLAIGVGVAAITGVAMLVLVRRANAQRNRS